jgi:hypothetical protein
MDYIDFAAIVDLGSPQDADARRAERKAILDAEVIIAEDLTTKTSYTVFGTPPFEQTTPFGEEPALRTIRVGLNKEQGELEKLAALVRVLKSGRQSFPDPR